LALLLADLRAGALVADFRAVVLVVALRAVVLRADLRAVVRVADLVALARVAGFRWVARTGLRRVALADLRALDLLAADLLADARRVDLVGDLLGIASVRAARARPSVAAWAVSPRFSLALVRRRLCVRSCGVSYFDAPASLNAIAIACFGFLTFLAPRAVFNSPCLYSCMTRLTVLRWVGV
jgi:hypothetical protein